MIPAKPNMVCLLSFIVHRNPCPIPTENRCGEILNERILLCGIRRVGFNRKRLELAIGAYGDSQFTI